MGPKRESTEPHLFVVFGGSGALMERKLLPALWRLATQGRLNKSAHVLGVARRAHLDDASYRSWARHALTEAGLPPDPQADGWCRECLHYHSLSAQTDADYDVLARRIGELERAYHLPGNRVLYLAVPPAALVETVDQLGRTGLNHGPGWTRLVVEKPFGRDYDSAVELDRLIKQYFDESQVYRIDHYLGKEAVQNLMVFRFANPIFESVWNRDRVASVQITVAESVGVEGRAEYYDSTGVVRDMMQNHLLQLLALTAMESPPALEADAVRDEKAKVLRSLRALDTRHVVLGQYTAGEIDGQAVPAYTADAGVPHDSRTATFVALQAHIDNWRWHGVPFFLRTGKRLPVSARQIVVNFRCPVLTMFRNFPETQLSANALVITIEPNEGFELLFEVKVPGELLSVQTQRLHFRYDDVFERLPEAYEALLVDLVHGDQTLFVRIDEVLEAWRVVAPLLAEDLPVHPYAAGTWGPPEADRLTVPTGAACML